MPIVATPAGRRIAMAVLLLLAVSGGVIRHYAPNPSTLRDFGTLLLVMWLPAVGNLIAYLIRKLPRRAPRAAAGFDEDAPFRAQLRVALQRVEVPAASRAGVDAHARQCALIVGSQGFTARLDAPVGEALDGECTMELLRPEVALRALAPGTAFHVLVGPVAVARGQVLEVLAGR